MQKTHGKNAFFFVLVVVLLDMIGFGLVMPVMPALISELTGKPEADAVLWAGPIIAVYALMNFLFSPLLGSLSDRFGRRPVILISVATLGINFLITGLATSIWILFIGRVLSGISGATFSTANAYIADVTEPENRGKAFGMVGAMFGLGFIIGPVVGGYLGAIDSRAPFFAAATLSLISVIYGIFVLPESLTPENRRPFSIMRANPFGAIAHFSKLPHIAWLLLAVGLFALAHNVYPAVWHFHGTIRYDWTSAEIGNSLGLVGLTSAIVQGGLIGPVLKKFGAAKTVWIGISVSVLCYIGYAFADLPWIVYMIIPISALGGLTMPALNSITSGQTAKNAQGELQGAQSSLQSLAQIIAPLMMTQVLYAFSTEDASIQFVGAPFLLAASLALCAMPLVWIGLRHKGHNKA
ncbi:TCR/Tet family MFS transporter [Hirschia litorea]|uniref:TCR/Tet family MFS transporter n=1 Tax=Hirschia litorea TaxID=1199156 RepID=A0ABW2IJ96_9PROT